MAVNDFTGKNIKDTYPRLVQTDGTNLADGTGSILPLTFEGNNVKISGSLIANEYVVSSSVTNISIATLSGSTTFGDSIDDTHVFNGNITASGNISASGNLEISSSIRFGHESNVNGIAQIIGPGNNDYIQLANDNIDIFINGSSITNFDTDSIIFNLSSQPINTVIKSNTPDVQLGFFDATNNVVRLKNHIIMTPGSGSGADTDYTNRLLISGSVKITGSDSHITASGNISASGTIHADGYVVDGYVALNSNSTTGRVFAGQNSTAIEIGRTGGTDKNISLFGPVTASGNISASGTIEAQNFLLGSVGGIFVKDTSGNTDDTAIANIADTSIIFGDTDMNSTIRGDTITLDANGDIRIDSATGLIRFQDSTVDSIVFNAQNGVGQITASGNVSSSGEIIAASGSFEIIHGGTF